MKKRSIVAVLSAFLMLAGMISPAAAAPGGKAKPIRIDQFNETFDNEGFADFISFGCGIDASVTTNEKGRVRVYREDQGGHYVEGHVSVRNTIVNEATGDTVIYFFSDNFSDVGLEQINGDTGTFSGQNSQRGLYTQWRSPGHGVIVREAGQITFTIDVVFDAETFDLISIDETVEFVGPHPLADTMGLRDEDNAAICSALGGSLQP